MMERRSSGPQSTASGSTHVPLLKALYRLRFDRTGGIQTVGSRSKEQNRLRFITHLIRSHPDRRSGSDGHDLFETVHDGPFHRNR